MIQAGFYHFSNEREWTMAKKKKRATKKQRARRKIIIVAVEILVLLIVLGILFVYQKMAKLDTGNVIHRTDIKMNDLPETTDEVLESYTNIAIFGLDNRSNGYYSSGNSDVIMVASINNQTKEVKLVSVYRDTLLDIGDDKYRKANAAFAYGGAEQAINMLNTNLDLDITDYVAVDFRAVAEAVDILGGVEIELTSEEARLMNGQSKYQDYIGEIMEVTGKRSSYVSAGYQTLDGVQATAYARIRYTAGDDFKRTERQRLVITKMVEKALDSDLGTINELVDTVFPLVETSMTQTDILLLAKDVFSYSMGETTGFPFDKGTMDISSKVGDCVVPLDLESNVEQLHEFFFGETDYEASANVKANSRDIIDLTGMTASDAP